MTQTQFDDGADARALQFALNTCEPTARVAPFIDPPPTGADDVALGAATERRRVVALLQNPLAVHDPAATIAAIEGGE